MSKTTKSLPDASRSHLFQLATNATYRKNADSSSYDFVPSGDGKMGRRKGRGESLRKFGYNANLRSGTASRRSGEPDPGRYRLAIFTSTERTPGSPKAITRQTWWVAEHVPGNAYKFHKIIIPACKDCGGTADRLCELCGGAGRVEYSVEHLAGPCPKCAQKGFQACAKCSPNPVVIDGRSISKNQSDWA